MRLYRTKGNLAEEVKAIHEFLKHIGYPYGKDFTGLLAETSVMNQTNANRLRAVFAENSSLGMKRFTIPVDFGGIKYKFDFYVADLTDTEDQFRWVEKVPGARFPKSISAHFVGLQRSRKRITCHSKIFACMA